MMNVVGGVIKIWDGGFESEFLSRVELLHLVRQSPAFRGR